MPPQDLLTLSRQDLYELAWSKPLVDLAKDFGLSDVALAKRCRKLGIPIPGRGYWAKVAAGQTPRQPPLKQREEKWPDHTALTFDPPDDPDGEKEDNPAGTSEHAALRERIAVLQAAGGADHSPASAAIKRTAVLLKRPWRNSISWNRGEKTGATVQIEASDLVVDRALRIPDCLLGGAEKLGWLFKGPAPVEEPGSRFRPDPDPAVPAFGCIHVQGEPLAFRIDERRRQVDHLLTAEELIRKRRGALYYQPRWDYVNTGELCLHLMYADARHTIRTWKDSTRRPLETQINTILLAFLDQAQQIKQRREERLRQEAEDKRREAERYQLYLRRSSNGKLIHQLEAQAGAWLRARLLRSYLRAVRRTAGTQEITTTIDDKEIDFLAWATHYVDQLDPLSSVPHDSDLMDERQAAYAGDDGIRQTLSRLLGRQWQDAWKIKDATCAKDPKSPAD